MDSVIAAEIARLENMTVTKLAEKFETLIGEKCRSRNKRYLIRRIAWRLQANAEGGLSERALKRAAELALDSEVRVTPPKHSKSSQAIIAAAASSPVRDRRLPPNGSLLHRDYKGKPIRVLVMEDTFEYDGQVFKTLTEVANAITGSHVNGLQFFKLRSSK
ncbi:MAG TPA: DUF2924 domain-containing protein [Pirellulaceae bacterium]|nr:DUF2924 domain-containing protein [Pirellulaceae bacterium]HMO94050.1 DUF2924 domain-containing protein [Pirellulaceae bacterium]HMP70944.1 DUF2924 domain-containing protein [Pirellulaceae bacterium]